MYDQSAIQSVVLHDGPMEWHQTHYTKWDKPRRVPRYRIQQITFVDGTMEFRRIPGSSKV